MLDDDSINELVNLLLKVPVTVSYDGRRSLIPDIANVPDFAHVKDDRGTHLRLLLKDLDDRVTPEGKRCLLIFIENAYVTVKEVELGPKLLEKKYELLYHFYSHLNELSKPAVCDLEILVQQFIESLPPSPQLSGIVFKNAPQKFLSYFCERLEFEYPDWSQNKPFVEETLTVHPLGNTVSNVISNIALYRSQLKFHPILQPVNAYSTDDLTNLWHGLQKCFVAPIDNRLILIVNTRAESKLPHNLILLPSAKFKGLHVRKWIGNLARKMEWPPYVIEQWANYVEKMCKEGEELNVEMVYEYLKETGIILKHHQRPEQFINVFIHKEN